MGGLSVSATGLGLRTRQGEVFDEFSLHAASGSLTAICGPAGSGRSALLMVLAGRMKFTSGSLSVDGWELPQAQRWLRARSSVAPLGGFLALEPGLRVQEEVGRARWLAGHKNLRGDFEDAARMAGLADQRKVLIRDLSAPDRNRLAIASAFVQADAQLILVDDLGSAVARDDQIPLWELLREGVAATGVTAIVTSLEREPANGIADQILQVGRPAVAAAGGADGTVG